MTRNTVEVITKSELRRLLEEKESPHAYWGFEPSGLMHLGMGLVCGAKIKDLIQAGFKFTLFLADWHAWINDKLGGLLENIRISGEYFKHCFSALGITNIDYVWASDIVSESDYWRNVLQIAKKTTLRRIRRSLPIMGRSMEMPKIETAWLYYPCMQAADIFYLDVDIACAGIDQRKAHMLAREVAEKLKWKKPICIHTPLLLGLKGPKEILKGMFDEDEKISFQISSKMSKSIPGSCIFIHDSKEEVRKKILGAYCPAQKVENNPIIEIIKQVILVWKGSFQVLIKKTNERRGFKLYRDLERAYEKGEIHPFDLKEAVVEALNELLEPIREYFKRHRSILKQVQALEITR